MDLLTSMTAFRHVAKNQSFAAAAREINVSRSVISRRVSQLEERLGVLLLHRSTRRVSLTPEGTDFFEDCVRILSDLEESEQRVHRAASSLRGVLSIAAPTTFGASYVAPMLCDLQEAHSELVIRLILLDGFVDLAGQEFDAVVRDVPGPTGVHHEVLSVNRHVLVAAPSYGQRFGFPKTLTDLAQHRCVHYSYLPTGGDWRLFDASGETHSVRIDPLLTTNSGTVLRQSALSGIAIAQLPSYMVSEDVARGDLVQVLTQYDGETYPISVVSPPKRLAAPRVKAFVSLMRERLAGTVPLWDQALFFNRSGAGMV